MNINVINDYKPICMTKRGLLLYKKEALFLMETQNCGIEYICSLPIVDSRRFFCFSKFTTSRLMHISVYCGIEVDDGALIAFNKGIYFVDLNKKKVYREHNFRPSSMRRPLNMVNICDVGGCNGIYYGEYYSNDDRDEVLIWKRTEAAKWEVVYSFEKKTIRHIHAIVPDSYNNRVLVATGDLDSESAIWTTSDGFKHLKNIVSGKQIYRTCCIWPEEKGIIIVTDSPYDDNHVYYISNKDLSIDVLQDIEGPVVFYTKYKDMLVFATNIENDGRNCSLLRQMIINKRGSGVSDWYVHVYCGNKIKGFRQLFKMKKDFWPMYPFGFGNVHFVQESGGNKIFFYPTAVKKYNEKLCMIDMKEIDINGKR